ncbi:hypothetical protein [Lactococcus petauri]|nr:hypothetical protein [Lactococcus petauri]
MRTVFATADAVPLATTSKVVKPTTEAFFTLLQYKGGFLIN